MAPGPATVPLLEDEHCQQISAAQKGCSTGRALVIAGLASLLCLMVCCQIFTVFVIINQMEQIADLQKSKNEIDAQMDKLSQADSNLGKWIMEGILEKLENSTTAKESLLNDTAVVENLLGGRLQKLNLQPNETFSENLLRLQQQMNESEWQSFETWMQNWLMFQKAQKTFTNTSQSETKCQEEAGAAVGVYKPQCDWMGRYVPMQCYGSTGYCWCSDGNGSRISGTLMHGQPDCLYENWKFPPKDYIFDDY